MSQVVYSTKCVISWPEERDGKPGYGIQYQDGYVSWCPKEAYERDYEPVTAMSLGHALHALERGRKVARAGWNGKGMWLAYTPGSVIPNSEACSGACMHLAEQRAGDVFVNGHIDMKAADGTIVIGWLASQTDLLARDWTIVD